LFVPCSVHAATSMVPEFKTRYERAGVVSTYKLTISSLHSSWLNVTFECGRSGERVKRSHVSHESSLSRAADTHKTCDNVILSATV